MRALFPSSKRIAESVHGAPIKTDQRVRKRQQMRAQPRERKH